ncbi:MarR family winged helix-turn-helix transcriptional regulator [Robbsia andropogonis]|uniref:MarR family winged helix-turn-helix transcriptional regulator n=1 Tax=Robbsia andropogonis TaxID=28092 RepID=UPI000463D802|nr:MarR family winged helix-turn-helix transcriptional regulator [Robbsia andropogonis]
MPQKTTLPLTPQQQVHLALSSELVLSARAWRKTADSALTGFGLSSAAALPLLLIGRRGNDGVRQVTLAHELGIEGPSLVRLLDQLCMQQLARRDDDPADGRAKIVSLTENGVRLAGKLEAHLAQLRASLLEAFSDDELQIALRVIRSFSSAVGASSVS